MYENLMYLYINTKYTTALNCLNKYIKKKNPSWTLIVSGTLFQYWNRGILNWKSHKHLSCGRCINSIDEGGIGGQKGKSFFFIHPKKKSLTYKTTNGMLEKLK
jgi:hypothetical protein